MSLTETPQKMRQRTTSTPRNISVNGISDDASSHSIVSQEDSSSFHINKDVSSTNAGMESIDEFPVLLENALGVASSIGITATTISAQSPHVGGGALMAGVAHLCRQWKILLAGQVISFLVAATGAMQATLTFDCHLSAPTLTLGTCYALLSLTLVYVVYQYRIRQRRPSVTSSATNMDNEGITSPPYYFLHIVPLQAPPLAYLPMAVLDVYANYFTILAFKYTTITSVTLFDALAIPSAMILSRIFLRRHYSIIHLVAVGSCLVGILINVWQDYEDDRHSANRTTRSGLLLEEIYPHRTLGDVLAILGGILFGASNTYGEYAVRSMGGPYEYIGMMSFYGTLICLGQMFLIERQDMIFFTRISGDESETAACPLDTAQGLLVGFAFGTVAVYLGTARFLEVSDAAFLNLGLLTGDLWSVLFSIFEEGIIPGALFFVALVFIVSGVIVYEMTDEPSHGPSENLKEHGAIELTKANSSVSDQDNETEGLLSHAAI
jgi:solute carrier family 35 protein F1/2